MGSGMSAEDGKKVQEQIFRHSNEIHRLRISPKTDAAKLEKEIERLRKEQNDYIDKITRDMQRERDADKSEDRSKKEEIMALLNKLKLDNEDTKNETRDLKSRLKYVEEALATLSQKHEMVADEMRRAIKTNLEEAEKDRRMYIEHMKELSQSAESNVQKYEERVNESNRKFQAFSELMKNDLEQSKINAEDDRKYLKEQQEFLKRMQSEQTEERRLTEKRLQQIDEDLKQKDSRMQRFEDELSNFQVNAEKDRNEMAKIWGEIKDLRTESLTMNRSLVVRDNILIQMMNKLSGSENKAVIGEGQICAPENDEKHQNPGQGGAGSGIPVSEQSVDDGGSPDGTPITGALGKLRLSVTATVCSEPQQPAEET